MESQKKRMDTAKKNQMKAKIFRRTGKNSFAVHLVGDRAGLVELHCSKVIHPAAEGTECLVHHVGTYNLRLKGFVGCKVEILPKTITTTIECQVSAAPACQGQELKKKRTQKTKWIMCQSKKHFQ